MVRTQNFPGAPAILPRLQVEAAAARCIVLGSWREVSGGGNSRMQTMYDNVDYIHIYMYYGLRYKYFLRRSRAAPDRCALRLHGTACV